MSGGLTVFGHRRDWGRDAGQPDAPSIHVRVFGFAGTVDVWRVPRDLRDSSYREILRASTPAYASLVDAGYTRGRT